MNIAKRKQQVIYIIPTSCLQVHLPYYESVSAGFPSPADDYIEDKLDLNQFLIQNKSATFFVKVEGKSMINAGIYPNDILIVDRSKEPQHEDVIVAYLEGEFTVKRLIKYPNRAWLKAENPHFSPIPITRDLDFRIWGVVTNVIHKPRVTP